MGIDEFTCRSLTSFLGTVFTLRRKWNYDELWFRGQMNGRWRLTPSFYRRADADEVELRVEFTRIGVHLITENQPSTPWEWYFIMQHHGAPTRLLDWTDGALYGLYFAVGGKGRPRPKGRASAVVWLLNPYWLNRHSIKHGHIALSNGEVTDWLPSDPLGEDKIKGDWPVAIDPPHVARRLAVQRSHFTVFGKRHDGPTELARRDSHARLAKIVIPSGSISKIQSDLETCGVHESALFPDLDALSRQLKDEFG